MEPEEDILRRKGLRGRRPSGRARKRRPGSLLMGLPGIEDGVVVGVGGAALGTGLGEPRAHPCSQEALLSF